MRRTVNTCLYVLFLLGLFVAAARADVYTFQPLPLAKGYVGPVLLTATWAANGSARDLSGAAGTITVYATAPVQGQGGTVLFSKAITPTTGNQAAFALTAADTARPGKFYCEVTITQAGVTDAWHGQCVIEGS